MYIAWVLLLAFMPIQVVKSFHHHDNVVKPSHELQTKNTNEHEHNDCPICNFTLSPFIQTDFVQITFVARLLPYIALAYQNERTFSISYSHGLRAPPAIA
ncbi:hypothetical protein [uncultured Bacteroides sp.]|uniref:hypothetical protein n=1 Tax=uncultured Bacteroides sp. TaxID=162156 RepID=UPI002AAB30BA|nr:hypothetical protein [uncultured Bacteroides sp.]